MKRILLTFAIIVVSYMAISAKTLVAYYSYTNNVHNIVTALRSQIEVDVIRIEPAEKGLDYAADNYAIGSAQIAAIRANPDDAGSYPAIDPVTVNLDEYDTVIVAAPLWWSNMAAPLQTFLFGHGKEMAGKNIGLIVSSASSGISGVEADAHRLIPEGKFLSPSLWIKSSQTSNAASMIAEWLEKIGYSNLAAISDVISDNMPENTRIFDLSGNLIRHGADMTALPHGIYIVQSVAAKNASSKKIIW